MSLYGQDSPQALVYRDRARRRHGMADLDERYCQRCRMPLVWCDCQAAPSAPAGIDHLDARGERILIAMGAGDA